MLSDSAHRNASDDQEDLGKLEGADTLRFIRHFSASVERVWHAITTPEGLAAWLAQPVTIETFAGGTFELAFNDDDRMDGYILEYEPNRRLVIAWHESSGASASHSTQERDESLVTFDLSPGIAGGTTLVFTHRYIRGGESMVGLGAGWHMHLAALRASLSGTEPVDRDALYARLKPTYEEHLGNIA